MGNICVKFEMVKYVKTFTKDKRYDLMNYNISLDLVIYISFMVELYVMSQYFRQTRKTTYYIGTHQNVDKITSWFGAV